VQKHSPRLTFPECPLTDIHDLCKRQILLIGEISFDFTIEQAWLLTALHDGVRGVSGPGFRSLRVMRSDPTATDARDVLSSINRAPPNKLNRARRQRQNLGNELDDAA
jgi:hypothetical protein